MFSFLLNGSISIEFLRELLLFTDLYWTCEGKKMTENLIIATSFIIILNIYKKMKKTNSLIYFDSYPTSKKYIQGKMSLSSLNWSLNLKD